MVIDPVTALFGAGRIDTHKTSDVRAILSLLKDWAEQQDATVLAVSHPSKVVREAMDAATGSQAFVAQARAMWLFSRDLNDGEVIWHSKGI